MSNPLDRVLADPRGSVAARPSSAVRAQEIAAGAGSLVENALQKASVHAGAGVVAIQALQAGAAEGNTQLTVVNTGLEPRYFELVLYPSDGPDAECPAHVLDPGATYRARLRAGDNPASVDDAAYKQRGVKVRDGGRVFLETGPAESGEAARLQAEVMELAAGSAAGWTGEGEVALPPGYADSTLVLRVRYREPDAWEPALATERRFAVRHAAGCVAAQSPLAGHTVEARFTPPPRTAMLYLTGTGPNRVLASGFLPDRPDRPHLRDFELPLLPDGPIAGAVEFVATLADWMDSFALGATGEVGPWLEEVLELYGDEASLMITDDTSAVIPWELFLLRDHTRFGARARVVRWVNTVYRDRPMGWKVEPVRVPRRIAAYLADSGSPLAGSPALAGAAHSCSDPDDLSDALLNAAEAGKPVGMVYLAACAGLAHDPEEVAALRAMSPAPEAVRFRLRGLEGKLSLRPLVFANAPYSARVPQAGTRHVGLACALLSQMASGYIGALGPVDAELGAEFAEQVLRATARDPEVRPAELLRALRERALAVAGDRTLSRAERRAAMVPFLYVYYGNPHLSIEPVEDEDG